MIRSARDLTVENVGAALVATGAIATPPVSLTPEPMGAGVGLLGTLIRLHLTWPDDVDGPASVVAKLPTTSAANQTIVDRFGYDRREAGVYRDLRPWERAPAPRALAQGWDDRTGRGWLLLEDLGHLEAGDQVAGATETQARATAAALARWHAAWWNDDALSNHRWLPSAADPVVAGYGTIFDLTWETCAERLGGVDDDIAAAVMEGRRWFDTAIEEFSSGPRTLVHGDARLDNVLFAPDHAVLLDFQLAARGRGAYDLAFFCAGSLTTDDRRRLEPELLDIYRRTLADRGIDVALPTLWRDYRLGHMLNLPNPVSALAVVSPGDARGAEMLRRNAERGLAAVADHVVALG